MENTKMITEKKQDIVSRVKNKRHGDTLLLLLEYSICWLILALIIYVIFRSNGRSFLCTQGEKFQDGKYQHYIAFDYLCEYLSSIWKGKGFSPLFNYTIGQGQDVLSALVGYDFTDPIAVFSAMITIFSRFRRYTLMIFIKLYLIGLSFITYCLVVEKKEHIPILSGAISYTFSGAVLFYFTRHPNFASWSYFYPFLLAGIELFYRKGRKLPFIVFVFWNALASYYTFYMNVILVAIYVIFRFVFDVNRRKSFRRACSLAVLGVLGTLLASIILLPVAYAYSHNARMVQTVGYTDSLLFYPAEFYSGLLESIFSPYYSAGYSTPLGLNVFLIIPLLYVLLFGFKSIVHRNARVLYKSLIYEGGMKWCFVLIVYILMLCIPVAGKVLNGFSYPTNRWLYALMFAISFILVEVFNEIKDLAPCYAATFLIITALWCVICLGHTETNTNTQKIISICLTLWVVLAMYFTSRYFAKYIIVFFFGATLLGAGFNIIFFFAPGKGNFVAEHDFKKDISFETSASAIPNDNSFFRVETKELTRNVSRQNNVNGTNSYWSIFPKAVLDYCSDLNLCTNDTNVRVSGLDGRTGLCALAGVKYFTAPEKDVIAAPFAYTEIASSVKKYKVFKNPYPLSIAYTYDGYIRLDEYEALDALEKEQALLTGAILEDDVPGYKAAVLSTQYENLRYDIEDTSGIKMENNVIEVKKKKGKILFSVEVPKDHELYFYFKNLHLDKEKPCEDVTIKAYNDGGSVEKYGRLTNSTYNWFYKDHGILFNLGSRLSGKINISLTFKDKCLLFGDPIELLAVPMAPMQEKIKKLGEHVLQDIIVRDDYVSGTIDLPEKRILQFSIPYSKGWTAIVDGQEQELLQSDIMYMALPLSAGKHSIQLYYHTPLLREGIIVSLVTLCGCFVYGGFNMRRKRRERQISAC